MLRNVIRSWCGRMPVQFGPASSQRAAPIANGNDASGTRVDPVQVGPAAIDRSGANLVRALPAPAHAQALIDWLQGPGGRTGTIDSVEAEEIYREMCDASRLEPLGWAAVARELRRVLGDGRQRDRRDGKRRTVFRVPPAGSEQSLSRVSSPAIPIAGNVVAIRRAG